MIKITVELYPLGLDKGKKMLGEGYIANDLTGTFTKGNYRARLNDAGGRKWKESQVKNFQRKKYLAWDLVYLALKEALEDRHGHSSEE